MRNVVVASVLAVIGLSAIADAVGTTDDQQTATASAGRSTEPPRATTPTPTTSVARTSSTAAKVAPAATPTTKRPTTKPPTTKPPATTSGATARCKDGTLSYSAHRRGTCSHHDGVAEWLKDVPA